jgi:hypothetical protein
MAGIPGEKEILPGEKKIKILKFLPGMNSTRVDNARVLYFLFL